MISSPMVCFLWPEPGVCTCRACVSGFKVTVQVKERMQTCHSRCWAVVWSSVWCVRKVPSFPADGVATRGPTPASPLPPSAVCGLINRWGRPLKSASGRTPAPFRTSPAYQGLFLVGVLELPYLFKIITAFVWGEIACCLLTLGGAADQISGRKTVHVMGHSDVGKVSR